MATLLIEALKGAQAEVAQQQGLFQQLRRAGALTGIMSQELRTALSLSPFGIRAARVWSALPTAGSPAANASPFGVVLYPAIPYGPQPRHKIDVYVPSRIYTRHQLQPDQQQQPDHHQHQQQQQQQEDAGVPVVFFVHGGIWVTGERWHFCPLATRLAQAGCVVMVPSYTLYPDALAGQMAGEVLAAYQWAAAHAGQYGGNPAAITVMGHSAGGHLASLALMMLAQHKHTAAQQQEQQQQQQQQQSHQQHQQPSSQPLLKQHQQQGASSGQHRGQQHQLPEGQLQQRVDLADAEAQHHHRVNPHTALPPPPQPPPPPPQQQQKLGPHWSTTGQHILSVPVPAAFIGMSSVYDVGRHFQFESLRGVAGISTMARACGGAVAFDGLSPAVLLGRAAAAATAAAAAAAAAAASPRVQNPAVSTLSSQQAQAALHLQQPQAALVPAAAEGGSSALTAAPRAPTSEPVLLGEIIPFRSGLDGGTAAAAAAAAAAVGSSTSMNSSGRQGDTSTGDTREGGAAAAAPTTSCSTSAVLTGFSTAAARFMPPCILMSSLADHMVPWHEAAEMHLALRRCGIPSKHLIYERALHNDFVLDWSPLKHAARPTAAPAGAPAADSAASKGAPLQAFAQDLMGIVTGSVRVSYVSGGTAQAAAALEALEHAAGLLQPHGRPDAPPGLPARVPQPLSRL